MLLKSKNYIPSGKRFPGSMAYIPGKRKNKYNNNIVKTKDGKFHSEREYSRFLVLKALEESGMISELKCQVRFELIPRAELPEPAYTVGESAKTHFSRCDYIADFTYKNRDGKLIVEDVKGCHTEVYKIKRKLMFLVHGIVVQEV